MKNAIIGILILLIIYLCAVIVRVENQRYAMSIGMCYSDQLKMPIASCLTGVQTRTNSFWHIYYAVIG